MNDIPDEVDGEQVLLCHCDKTQEEGDQKHENRVFRVQVRRIWNELQFADARRPKRNQVSFNGRRWTRADSRGRGYADNLRNII